MHIKGKLPRDKLLLAKHKEPSVHCKELLYLVGYIAIEFCPRK